MIIFFCHTLLQNFPFEVISRIIFLCNLPVRDDDDWQLEGRKSDANVTQFEIKKKCYSS